MSNAAARDPHQELNKALALDSLFSVKGLVAVVTGGGTGIGLMCTEALATHGAKVYITGRREEVLKRAVDSYQQHATGQIVAIQADVTSKDDLKKLVKEIEGKEPNGIQILINNAGISGPHSETASEKSGKELANSTMESESFEDWDNVWRTNVASIYFSTICFLPLLEKGTKESYRSGVINISSISGMVKISQSHLAYNASKAAAIHLTKMMATEVGRLGIRFNSIAPGVFPSEMNDISERFDPEKYKIPAGRPGKLEEMAASVLYRGQYCDGLVMNVDGGILL
ncbi:uncharacterized protein MELLADRAFT_51312 [Melampsora larici-populina 98AG31]|uniref:Uncharacterized protein n=1 Tax=Melampsora larici-populina (strain 98AG31 / pathotype 3-4-7) TaxID=747676 RepID=F4R3W4_MELLP|nr:uncharacterized protein MELLADRAFT_51312 [Melampsora larici-populina 98AG31]EGG13090.1 hypothetical protein MELLADRAFT_51312 [Melampsora larici-populina 98AG31]